MNASNHSRRGKDMNSSNNSRQGGGRIPLALQAIFLASNAGEEVDVPPRNMGFKVFSRILGGKKKKKVNDKASKTAQVSAPIKEEVCQTMCPFSVHQISISLETHAILSLMLQPSSPMEQVSPQEFLDNALKLRGYSNERYATINSGYSNMPTELQLVSYDVHILKMVIRDKDEHKLRDILTCGISLNACNKYGESLVHKVCKSGQDKLLKVFLDCGADIQVCDGAGRTPMHDACHGSKPSFKTFELLLKADPYLIHMMDGAGVLPLEYVKKAQYGAWNAFLASILDTHWNRRDVLAREQGPPPLALVKANSRPAPDPEQALSLELAALVSSGRMEPEDAIEAQFEADGGYDDESCGTTDDDMSTDDEFYYDDDEMEGSTDDELCYDDDKIAELLGNITKFAPSIAA
jgi:hypothetical protein